MAATSDARADLEAFLAAHQRKPLLRFITCGSVDDGKSTLIGRLLYESSMLHDDQVAALERDSKTLGTRDGDLDFALLVDGLAAEREQGITIDVAYRYFSTEQRRFIVADVPGHEQYTRNMVTGASTADLAVLLVDARKGLLVQTLRHSYLAWLLGIRRIVLAINKMDLVGYSREAFEEIVCAYEKFAQRTDGTLLTAIPMSAVHGDGVVTTGPRMPWYTGPSLFEHLDSVEIPQEKEPGSFRMPVQLVVRPNADFRGFAGQIAGGCIRTGARVRVMPSGRDSVVARIITPHGDVDSAAAGQSVTLGLESEVDVSRGDVLVAADAPLQAADKFEATIIWLHEDPLLPGRAYLMKIGTAHAVVTIAPLKFRVDVNSLERLAAEKLEMNEVGVGELELDRRIAAEPYTLSRTLGGFILIDRMTSQTVGAGLIHFALHRSQNVRWQALDVSRAARGALHEQRPCVLWFTGISGAGKSTIANVVERKLFAMGRSTYLLDGDNVRHGLNKDLGFTAQDRVENIRRVAEVARLMVDAGLIVLVAFISPFRAERRMARELLQPGEFMEIFVDTPLAEAERRDTKGLYARARAGEIRNFTGIDSPYESPENPEIRIDTMDSTIEQAADKILDHLITSGVLRGRS